MSKTNKRDQILASALALFNDQGVDKTPTSAISKHAGVATGTLFHHFKTKEELVNALYLDIKLEIHDETQPDALNLPVADISQANVRDALHQFWFRLMSWMLTHPEKFRFMVQFGESAYINSSTRETVSQLFQTADSLFSAASQAGVFRALPSTLLTSLMGANMIASANLVLQQPELWQQPSIQDELFNSCWGLLAH